MSPPTPRDRSPPPHLQQQLQQHDRRLDGIERNASDLAKSVGVLSEEIAEQATWRRQQELVQVREDERDAALYKRLDSIDRRIDEVRDESRAAAKEVRGVWVRIQWIIITAVVTGLVGWIVFGGQDPS